MESTRAYIISVVTALLFLLISALIAKSIEYEAGSNPKDPQKRRMWFWIIGVVMLGVNFLLGYFVFKPEANIMIVNNYITALCIGTGVALVLYIILGLVLSKIYRNGKIGHWFFN